MIKASTQDVLMVLGNWKPTTKNNRDGSPRYMAQCPVHDDEEPSLVVESKSDGRVLFNCYVGCDFRDVEEEVKRRLPGSSLR